MAKGRARFLGQDILKGEWKPRERERERMKTPNAIPGGSPVVSGYGADGQRLENTIGSENGVSIFDPVLCEIAYRWFSPAGGTILDPFSGGSVRGIVASKLGRQYIGIDLRGEQIEANRAQGLQICQDPMPAWQCGDSRMIDALCEGVEADLIFSCPPYADLEVYSEDPRDISTMEYREFIEAYREIIQKSCALLKKDRFACFVVGDVRYGKSGYYRNFVSDTIAAFANAGLELYNEAILLTAIGSLPIRAGRTFSATRKLGKTHQNVLIFVKSDPKKATEACGTVEIVDLDELFPDSATGAIDSGLEGVGAAGSDAIPEVAAGE